MGERKTTVHIINDMNKIAGAEQSLLNFINSSDDIIYLISLRKIKDEETLKIKLRDNTTLVSFNLGFSDFFSRIRDLGKIINSLKPDLVVSWMYHSNFITSLCLIFQTTRFRHIWTIHHNFAGLKNETMSTIAAIVSSALLARLPSKIAYASASSQATHKYVFGLAKASFILPNIIIGSDLDSLQVHTRPKVGMAARFHSNKGFDIFLGIVARSKSEGLAVDFLVCGEGAEFGDNSFTELTEEKNLDASDILALGNLDDIQRFYRDIDVLMCCSEVEGFGMVLAEAVASGLPVISTDVGAAREIIGLDGGIVVTPRNEQALYSAMVRLLPELKKTEADRKLQQAALRIKEKYGAQAVHAKFLLETAE